MNPQSRVRLALEALLAMYPRLDLVAIDWQVGHEIPYPDDGPGPLVHAGPWVLVELGQPSDTFDETPAWAVWQFAIFKRTGDLFRMVDGAVEDDPLLEFPRGAAT